MTALALKKESDNYWNLIKDASSEVKLALIKRLSDARHVKSSREHQRHTDRELD